jgi:hypothetical protein
MRRQGNNLKRKSVKSLSTQNRNYGFIQTNIKDKDGTGGFEDGWENAHPNAHWMGITPKASLQVFEQESINAEVTHVIKMRAEIPVVSTQRIVSDGKIYEILSIEDIQERGIVNWIFCKERLA